MSRREVRILVLLGLIAIFLVVFSVHENTKTYKMRSDQIELLRKTLEKIDRKLPATNP